MHGINSATLVIFQNGGGCALLFSPALKNPQQIFKNHFYFGCLKRLEGEDRKGQFFKVQSGKQCLHYVIIITQKRINAIHFWSFSRHKGPFLRYFTRFFCFLANKFFERKKEIFGVFGVAVGFSSVFSVCVPKFLCIGQGNL